MSAIASRSTWTLISTSPCWRLALHNVITRSLPVISHPALQNERLSDAERTRLSKRNFYRFLEKWGDREDLLYEYDED